MTRRQQAPGGTRRHQAAPGGTRRRRTRGEGRGAQRLLRFVAHRAPRDGEHKRRLHKCSSGWVGGRQQAAGGRRQAAQVRSHHRCITTHQRGMQAGRGRRAGSRPGTPQTLPSAHAPATSITSHVHAAPQLAPCTPHTAPPHLVGRGSHGGDAVAAVPALVDALGRVLEVQLYHLVQVARAPAHHHRPLRAAWRGGRFSEWPDQMKSPT